MGKEVPSPHFALPFVLVPTILVAFAGGAAHPEPGTSAQVSAVFDAIRSGDCDRVVGLVESHPESVNAPDADGQTPLHVAVLARKADIVAYLLDRGASANERDANGYTPVSLVALTSGSMELVRLLVDKGADLDAKDNWGATVMDLAETYRRHEMAGYLLDRVLGSKARRPEPRRDGVTLLHLAARCGSSDAILALIREGIAVGSATTSGWTPLHFAAEQGHAKAVALLLEHKAPIDARAVDGSTAHSLAVAMGHAEVAGILARKGADTREPEFPVLTGAYFGQTPPGPVAVPMAVGIVASRYRHHGSVTFSPDGREAYWAVQDYGNEAARAILESRIENGRWSRPRLASFSRVGFYDDVPFVSPDGRRLFFISGRSLQAGGRPDKERIWVMERGSSGWKDPQPLPPAVNALEGIHHQVSTDEQGDLYFAASPVGGYGELDIYCARIKGGVYQTPANLGPAINGPHGDATPFVAPDGSYLLFTRFQTSGWSLFISLRNKNGEWGRATDLSGTIEYPGKRNTECPILTRDGKYLFFAADVDNSVRPYWMDASPLQRLRR